MVEIAGENKLSALKIMGIILGVIVILIISYPLIGAAASLISSLFLPIVTGVTMYYFGKSRGRKEISPVNKTE